MPKISVIVPNYNHARFLRRRIDTVLEQTFRDFELILLDDCSTDDSRSILREYASDPRVRIEFNEVNSGSPFTQWKKGLGMACGEYIWIAESDDYANPRLLERLVAVLDSDPAVVFTYCRSWVVEEDGSVAGFVDSRLRHLEPQRWTADFRAEGREECASCFVYRNVTANASSVVFRKAVSERVGGVDDTLRTSGDWKLWAAMALTGKVAYVSEPLNYYRYHAASVRNTMSGALIVAEQLDVIRWILERVTPRNAALRRARVEASYGWVPALMSTHVPRDLKLRILNSVRAVDPHPSLRTIGPALLTLRLKLLRHWRDLRSLAMGSAMNRG
jgi:glycosyltransferase involved in cell wall biosynthesis